MSQDSINLNRARWDELVGIHARSAFYDVAGFKAGECSLRPLEVEELGDVSGKSLLHLQCHFGLDTLSWARRGAAVTGVDYSTEAIALARSLAQELNIPATFVCSDVLELPSALQGSFDVVFTSYGAICWLPDLRRWADVVRHFLKPGGTFYMAEVHPVALIFDDRPGVTDLRIGFPYFFTREPIRYENQGTYADRAAQVQNTTNYYWQHSLGDVVTAVASAGLRIEFLHEFPFCVCDLLPGMEEGADGWWRLKSGGESVPLLFSLKAAAP
jgi:SAM-dependent methyltransferase